MSLSLYERYYEDILGMPSFVSVPYMWIGYGYSACLERSIFNPVLVSDINYISITFDTTSAVVTSGSPIVVAPNYLDNSLMSTAETDTFTIS